MDLDAFLTQLYVLIDDWYQATFPEGIERHAGGAMQLSDSEILTLAIVAQWRAGVPWRSERGLVRYMLKHGRGWFPRMVHLSAFNERVRQLWAALVQVQQTLAEGLWREQDVYEVADCLPLPSCSLAHAGRHERHWLADSSLGKGGNHGGWFFGRQVLLVVSPRGVVSGWLLGHASTDDRWMLEGLLSSRQGQRQLIGPPPAPKQAARQTQPTTDLLGPALSCGRERGLPLLADRGFNGERWIVHWQTQIGRAIVTAPPGNSPQPWSAQAEHWLSSQRQIVETVAARLVTQFDWLRLRAHSTWGQVTRVAAIMAAYTVGLYFNHLLGRPLGALETLIV